MEDPDSLIQLSLPSLPLAGSARIIPLPPPGPTARTVRLAGAGQASAQRSNQPAAISPFSKAATTLWYAIQIPQLADHPQPQQQMILNALATLALEVSATVSLHPLALVCEIRSSLKYFGGIDVIHDKLKPAITRLLVTSGVPGSFQYAASPTVTGSLLLARSGHNTLVYRKDNLRSALGQLPTSVLELNKEQNRRLYNMGVRHLRDIWRLPGDGLRKRFGSDFINLLSRALGTAPEPAHNYLPPPSFVTCYDLPFEMENLGRLLPVADEMLAQLCDFLRRRDLSTSHLLFSLLHEKRERTVVAIGLRHPGRSQQHLFMLLETHFTHLSIPAPVIAVKLEVKKFDAFMSHSDGLRFADKPATGAYTDSHLNQFIEQLQARLGEHYVKSISSVAEHCPEDACEQPDYTAADTPQKTRGSGNSAAAVNPRPLWLLTEPLQLSVRNGKLYHRQPVSIVHGPERIETRWWSGDEVRRDYYIARESNGSRLWIYREKTGAGNWYLHGFFA